MRETERVPAEERAAAEVLSRTLPETILDSLECVDTQYGGVRPYLVTCGLTATEAHRLAARLVQLPIEAGPRVALHG